MHAQFKSVPCRRTSREGREAFKQGGMDVEPAVSEHERGDVVKGRCRAVVGEPFYDGARPQHFAVDERTVEIEEKSRRLQFLYPFVHDRKLYQKSVDG